jgi:hypothetical protein
MDSDIENKPLNLKIVTLMDVTPGRADKPDGEAISIITFSHKGEIEPSMLLNLRDTKKLAITLFAILAHFEESKAKKVMDFFEQLKREEEES